MTKRVMGWFQVAVLTALGVFGLVVTAVQFSVRDPKWLEENPAVILGVLSFVALHLAIDRTQANVQRDELAERLERLEHRIENRESDYLAYLRATGHYIRVQAIRRFLAERQHFEFPRLASELLREPFTLLDSLAAGRLNIPEPQIPAVQAALGLAYDRTFEAVTDSDLDFWLDDEAFVPAGYFEQNVTAIRNGTAVSRIFITTLKVMQKRLADVEVVLTTQQKAGVAWGLCLRDDFDVDVRNQYQARTDFAIFNNDEVVTYFDIRSMRRFEAVFNLHGERFGSANEREIQRQRE